MKGDGDDGSMLSVENRSTHVQSEFGKKTDKTQRLGSDDEVEEYGEDNQAKSSGKGGDKKLIDTSSAGGRSSYTKSRPRNVPRRELIGNMIIDTNLDHSDSYKSLERIDESVSQSEEAKILPHQSTVEVIDQATIESKKWEKAAKYQEKFKSRQTWDVD